MRREIAHQIILGGYHQVNECLLLLIQLHNIVLRRQSHLVFIWSDYHWDWCHYCVTKLWWSEGWSTLLQPPACKTRDASSLADSLSAEEASHTLEAGLLEVAIHWHRQWVDTCRCCPETAAPRSPHSWVSCHHAPCTLLSCWSSVWACWSWWRAAWGCSWGGSAGRAGSWTGWWWSPGTRCSSVVSTSWWSPETKYKWLRAQKISTLS